MVRSLKYIVSGTLVRSCLSESRDRVGDFGQSATAVCG